MSPTSNSAEAGFTLIELLAVIIVGGVLLAALTTFYLAEQRAFRQQQIEIATSQSLRVALEQIVRDLRVAGRNPTGTANIGLTHAGPKEVRFTLDADGNGDSAGSNETKGFKLDDGIIKVYVAGAVTPWQEFAEHFDPATTQIFQYYDSAGNLLAPPGSDPTGLAAVRRIDVSLTVTNRVPGGTITRREAASVRLRNIS